MNKPILMYEMVACFLNAAKSYLQWLEKCIQSQTDRNKVSPVRACTLELICFTLCLYFHAVKFILSISEPVLTPNVFMSWTHLDPHQSIQI